MTRQPDTPDGEPAELDPATVNYIDIGDFRRTGYLQEVNRCFLHPLGLALEITVRPDGTEVLGGIWDYREDPEGIAYGGPVDPEKGARIEAERQRLSESRKRVLGFDVQPLDHPGVNAEAAPDA